VRGIRDALANAVNWTEVMGYIIEEVLEPWYRDSHNLEEGQGSGFREDVDVVVEIAQEYPDPAEFIAFANKMLEATHKEDAADEVVILGTIHALKGRERPVVFWVGAAEGICPTPFALGQVVQRENELPPPGGPSLMEDERCCAYVVVTRAQQHVIITAPEVYRQKVVPVSRFVHELLGDVIAGEVTHTQGLSPQEAQEC
jgi:superfamily I DNA/RNA helicase